MIIQRYSANPILKPDLSHSWESEAVFNGCPIKRGKYTFLLYRALSLPHQHMPANVRMMVSSIGLAQSSDGRRFDNRTRFIVPEHDWERYGCEDPRVTELKGTYYIFYTALSAYPFQADGIKVGLAMSRDLKTIEMKHLVTPFNAKGMALFPEEIEGKIYALVSVHTDKPPTRMCVVEFPKESALWSSAFWSKWYPHFEEHALNLQRAPADHVEVGAPPIKTKEGWLVIYSYIRNYFSPPSLFTVEAVLLDLKNPKSILARTRGPLLTPEEYYERLGLVPNIVFPSGALKSGDQIQLYYGAADTTCALAFIDLPTLLDHMLDRTRKTLNVKRSPNSPVITPNKLNSWESKATFNPAAIQLEGKVHIVYRAMSHENTSVLGYAVSKDGIHIDERLSMPIYEPREPFEQKEFGSAFSGCEDPRLTLLDNRLYMTYTAFNGKNVPRVALTWIQKEDFLNRNFRWARPKLLSAPDHDDKDAFVFPKKVNGKFLIVHRYGDDIDYSLTDTLNFSEGHFLDEHRWIAPRRGWWDSRKVGAGAPPVAVKEGWLLLYHGVSEHGVYRVGAVLLDPDNPLQILGRTDDPIFEPEMNYEKFGMVPNVVFPCGNVLRGETLIIYYGGADQVIGIVTVNVNEILGLLKDCRCLSSV
jgi:predicted GH43/DUF377 family glycosyl hydrolase